MAWLIGGQIPGRRRGPGRTLPSPQKGRGEFGPLGHMQDAIGVVGVEDAAVAVGGKIHSVEAVEAHIERAVTRQSQVTKVKLVDGEMERLAVGVVLIDLSSRAAGDADTRFPGLLPPIGSR